MSGIYFLVPTLIAIAISMLIVRAGAIALMMTGMSFEKAKFQALSAFSGTGFTTHETELVVNNPKRRKIVTWLMVFGSAGIVTVIVTATSSFTHVAGLEAGLNFLFLTMGITLIWYLARRTALVRKWEIYAESKLKKLSIFDDDKAVDELLHLEEGFGVVRIRISKESQFVGQTISDSNSALKHSFILGIERKNEWIPIPSSTEVLLLDDNLVVYGQMEDLGDHFGYQ